MTRTPVWLFLPSGAAAAFFLFPPRGGQLSDLQLVAVSLIVLLSVGGIAASVLRVPLARTLALPLIAGWWAASAFVFGWAARDSLFGLFLFWPYWTPLVAVAALHTVSLARVDGASTASAFVV